MSSTSPLALSYFTKYRIAKKLIIPNRNKRGRKFSKFVESQPVSSPTNPIIAISATGSTYVNILAPSVKLVSGSSLTTIYFVHCNLLLCNQYNSNILITVLICYTSTGAELCCLSVTWLRHLTNYHYLCAFMPKKVGKT